MSNTAISPTGYANLLMSQISPQHSLDPQLNFGSSHHFQHTRRDRDTNNTDEAGQPVSAQRAKTIRLFMLSCFRQLESQGLAPESIGQASLKVIHWLIHMLHKHYIEFRLCADNWKAMKLMIDNYSQWYHYHVVKKQTIKSEDESPTPAVTPPSSSSSTPAVTPPSSASSMPSLKRVHVGINPVAEPALKRQRVEVEDLDEDLYIPLIVPVSPHNKNPETLQHPSLEREPTPPPRADKGKEKELIAVEINNPLSNIVFKPRPRPITKKLPTSTSVADSSTSETPTSESTTTAPPSKSDTDASSLAVKMELMASNPAKSIPPNTIDSKPQPTKKCQPSTKPMRVSSKITARNLCALEWQSNGHQKEPASVFAIFWNGLSSTDKEAYKRKAVQQLGSAGLPATVVDADEE
ncbi:hypothetical protein EV702DRAFT_1202709 [Suillus placidus]|uniref:Uncharacterized protein n=1 Tax=Suillus placidus TaxID=48579 RepID=A0A9P6ZL08_9AGAM|nr:hypothetical protein EV702DRAFT_1202709 [Suillus placidus]